MVSVTTKIKIKQPIDVVSGFASNPENATKWYKNIKSVELKTERPMRVGSQIAFVAHFMGRQLYYTYKITDWTDNLFVMETSDGPFPMKTIYKWEAIDENQTQMFHTNTGVPKGFSKIFQPFMSIMMRSANNKDLKKLKFVLEH